MLGMIDMTGLQKKDSAPTAHAKISNKASFMLLHGRLATDCSFSICDGKVDGFPLRYASQGFVDLFGYSNLECTGKQCGSLVGAPAILASDPALRYIMQEAPGLDATRARERLGFLTEYVAEQMKRMAANPEVHLGHALLVNQKKNGDLFVCELMTRMHKHPTLGWPYVIGIQHDISDDVPVSELLEAAGTRAYAALIERRSGMKAYTVEQLNASDTVAYMHHKAFDMWQAQMWDLVGPPTTGALDKANRDNDGAGSKRSKRSGKSCKSASSMGSLGSRSTRSTTSSASGSSASSHNSSASSSWSSGSRQVVPANAPKDRFLDLLDEFSDDDWIEQDLGGLDDVAEEEEGQEDGISPAWRRQESAPAMEQEDENSPAGRRQESAPAILCSTGAGSLSAFADVTESAALDRYYDLLDPPMDVPMAEEGRLNPNALSAEVQSLAETFLNEDFAGFSQALLLVDSSQQGCPIIGCNEEFSRLTGYSAAEAGGRSCFFMTEAAPLDLIDEEVSIIFHNFFSTALRDEPYRGQQIEGASERTLLSGEMACKLTMARKSGELFLVLAFFKQVELDDQNVVVGLFSEIAEEAPAERDLDQAANVPTCLDNKASDGFTDFAWARDMSAASDAQSRLGPSGLEAGMVALEGLLGGHYWYSAPMRRQTAA